MKTKPINLTINIPAEYHWLAVQPFGGITLFKEKPGIIKDPESNEEYWGLQDGEINLFDENILLYKANETDKWKESLRCLDMPSFQDSEKVIDAAKRYALGAHNEEKLKFCEGAD